MQENMGGLRDRKRLQTRARIEQAAVDLVLCHGLQEATVELICEQADISPRTFFNYFDSKADAVLGLSRPEITPELVLSHSHNAQGHDVVEAVIGLILELTSATFDNLALRDSRVEILRVHPELVVHQITRLPDITGDLLAAIGTLMALDPRFADFEQPASAASESILALCSAAVKTAAQAWIAAGSNTPRTDIKTQAVHAAHDLVKRLQ